MIKPLSILVIIMLIGVIITVIHEEKNRGIRWADAMEQARVEYIKECAMIDGCKE